MDFAAKLKDKFVRVFLFKLYWQHDLAKKFGKVEKCTAQVSGEFEKIGLLFLQKSSGAFRLSASFSLIKD